MYTTGLDEPANRAVFGIVIIPKAVLFAAATVNDTVVVSVGGYDVIIALFICELVKFPLIPRSTIVPALFVADTVVADGFGVGEGFGVGVVPGLGDEVGVGVGVAFYRWLKVSNRNGNARLPS